ANPSGQVSPLAVYPTPSRQMEGSGMLRTVRLAGLALLGLTGCSSLDALRPESELQQVPTSPFPPSVTQTVKPVSLTGSPAASDIAWRVDAVGRGLIDSNGWVGLMPRFRAVGNSEPQISHMGTDSVTVSDALVHQCKSEAELAAVLASELGKMV